MKCPQLRGALIYREFHSVNTLTKCCSTNIIMHCTFFLAQLYTIIFNLTTNERANYRRYRHFKTANGRYKNPFDRGLIKNCLEYWNVIDQVGVVRRRSNHMV